jgi:hypothetical protein
MADNIEHGLITTWDGKAFPRRREMPQSWQELCGNVVGIALDLNMKCSDYS